MNTIYIQSPKWSRKVSDFFELALKRSQFQNVTDNRKYRKNVTNDQAENKKAILNNTDTISIVGTTELKDLKSLFWWKKWHWEEYCC